MLFLALLINALGILALLTKFINLYVEKLYMFHFYVINLFLGIHFIYFYIFDNANVIHIKLLFVFISVVGIIHILLTVVLCLLCKLICKRFNLIIMTVV